MRWAVALTVVVFTVVLWTLFPEGRGANADVAVLLAEDMDVDGVGGAWDEFGRPVRRRGEVWPWEEPGGAEAWAKARRDSEVVEGRHRRMLTGEEVGTERDAVVYFMHVHKAGGTSVCESARANGELTTRTADWNQVANTGYGENCNLVWVSEEKGRWWRQPMSPWPWHWIRWNDRSLEYEAFIDMRLRGGSVSQNALAERLSGVCEDEEYLAGLRWPWMWDGRGGASRHCGVSFVAIEVQMSGKFFWKGPRRPWVYVAVVRDPLDIVLSQHYMAPILESARKGLWSWQKTRAPTEEDLLAMARSHGTYGHLVTIFGGCVREKYAGQNLAQATERLPHFSALVDTTHNFAGGFEVLSHKLGWDLTSGDTRAGAGARKHGAKSIRSGTRAGSNMRQEPAYRASEAARRALKESFRHDLEFYRIAALTAAIMVDELSQKKTPSY